MLSISAGFTSSDSGGLELLISFICHRPWGILCRKKELLESSPVHYPKFHISFQVALTPEYFSSGLELLTHIHFGDGSSVVAVAEK